MELHNQVRILSCFSYISIIVKYLIAFIIPYLSFMKRQKIHTIYLGSSDSCFKTVCKTYSENNINISDHI